MSKLGLLDGLRRAVGWRSAVDILTRRMFRVSAPVRVRAGGYAFGVRPLDSDLFVASQIFGSQEYHPGALVACALRRRAAEWRAEGRTPVIIDGGANVGYAALFFAQQHPDAVVVAVEPDPVTFRQLAANCAGVDRILPVLAAVWSHENGVSLVTDRGHGSWAHQVVEAGATPSRTLASLIAMIPGGRPLIIKLDIEGAEREVCAASADALREAACLMIEPHDFMVPGAGCLSALYSALDGRRVDTLLRGENLILYDSSLVPA